MLIRPGRCPHSVGLRRLQPSTTSPVPSRWPSMLPRSVGVDRRLLTTQSDLRPSVRKTFRTGIGFLPERSLATILTDFSTLDDVATSIGGLPGSQYPMVYPTPLAQPSGQQSGRPLWELRPHNATAPLIVEESNRTIVRQRISTRGVPGDIDEMLPVLNACLQVGKLERAKVVLARLGGPDFALAPDEMIELHNRYIRAVLDQALTQPEQEEVGRLHSWYELQINSKQLPQTPETIAYMLKATLLTAQGPRRKRLIERYMGMAPGYAGLEVLYMTEILNDQDRAAITKICKTYNLGPQNPEITEQEQPAVEEIQPSLFEIALQSIDPEAASSAQPAEATGAQSEESAVLGTPQKGMGLRMLKRTLSLFSEIPEGRDIANLGLEERREIQSRLERDCVDAAVERWRDENQALLKMGLNTSLTTASLNSRLHEWHKDLELRLSQELKKVELSERATKKNKEDLNRCIYGPFLRQSTPSRLAAVTIVSTLSSLASQGADRGVTMSNVITQIAKVTEEDIRLLGHVKKLTGKGQRMSAKVAAKNAVKSALRRSIRPPKELVNMIETASTESAAESIGESASETTTASATESAAETTTISSSTDDLAWPITIKAKVGAALLSLLMEVSKVTVVKEHPETKTLISQQQPAFSRVNQYRRGKKISSLLPNQMLVELMMREPRGDFLARHLPMVVEPQPWTKFEKGGFLEYSAPLVRMKDNRKDQKIYAEAAIGRGDMDQVLKGLDVLGRTAWKVNRPVFDTMLEAWNTGEEIADIPPLAPEITIPAEPDSSEDPMKRRSWLKAVKAAENHRSGLHSVRCFMNFQMEVANAFRDQTFYFPHNVDFRGRAYPIPPYFNHMGADNVRGLLLFAKGKALGEDGLRWLKVHLSNVYGFDKASLTERAEFADEHLDDIRDSATNPLKGNRWWLEAEDPWQCLAACFELKAAMDLEDPTQYESHLPVHQDGTCNGLQHYAALGGDTWGAQQVNLIPGERPSDVYSAVADIVKESIAEDLKRGDQHAKALTGLIKRKVVKQTVMTNVYGVTFAGARKQVLKQLDALYPNLEKESGIAGIVLASYIATKIFKALSTMFSGAHDIQNWLGEIGGRVCRALTPDQIERIMNGEPDEVEVKTAGKKLRPSKASKSAKVTASDITSQFRSTLVWTTPLQMPVVQPYRKSSVRAIETCLQDLILSSPTRTDPVNMRKQLQAFPPNFIHSLDASHMLLSALECDALGLSFAAVHDSFWTHASDINTMNRVLRDAFIRIHSEDVVGRLSQEFQVRYRDSIYLAQFHRTSSVAKKILAFRKNHRMSLKDELVLEKKRLDLLNAEDPKLVRQGRKMVTPASIYDKVMAEEGAAAAEAAIVTEKTSTFESGTESHVSGHDGEEMADAVTSEMDEGVLAHTGIDADTMEASSEAAEEDADKPFVPGNGTFEAQMKNIPTAKKTPTKREPVKVWMPLSFPPVPAKGDFDVRDLKDSKYFFS